MKNKVAVFCNSVPDEIINAAGLISEKIVDISQSHDISNRYLSNNLCSYSKNALDYLFKNRDDYVGMIFTNTCHAMETSYEVCKRIFKDKFVYMLNVPRDDDLNSVNYLTKELDRIIKALESYFDIEITEEKLVNSFNYIESLNRIRQEINELCACYDYEISSVDYKKIEEVYEKLDKESYKKLYESLLERRKSNKDKVRVMLCGSNLAPLEMVDCVEEMGGKVIFQDFNNGYRRINFVSEDKDYSVRERIAINYLRKPSGTMTPDLDKRIKTVLGNIKKYDVDLVFLSVIKFCSDEVFFSSLLSKYLKEKSIPYLILNTEYESKCSGQLLTRIEAMMETIY